jgi:hypothetical protein
MISKKLRQQGFLFKQGTGKLNLKVDLNQGSLSVLLGHPQFVDTVSSVMQSQLIRCI